MRNVLLIMVAILCSCGSISKYTCYSELKPEPYILIEAGNYYLISSGNSMVNSAYSIYKVKVSIEKNEVLLFVKQGVWKRYKDKHRIKISPSMVNNESAFFWVDPNNEKHFLDLRRK